MKNQKGFTIVELLIGMTILSIVAAALTGFIVSSSKSYAASNTEIMIQQESQLAMNQISDVIIDTTRSVNYVGYSLGGSDSEQVIRDSDFTIEVEDKSLVIYNGAVEYEVDENGKFIEDEDGNYIIATENGVPKIDLGNGNKNYQIYWDKSEGKILFTEIDNSETDFSTGEQYVLAEYVKDFSVDLSQVEEKRVVSISIIYEYNNRTYETSNNITIRNKVLVNSLNLVVNKTIELSIRVKEPEVILEPGETYRFSTPIIEGRNILDKSVTWSISTEEGKKPLGADTKFTDTDNGIIHIDNTENVKGKDVESFIVTVTTKAEDSARKHASAEVVVYVKRAKEVALSKTWDSDDNDPWEISPGCTFTITADVSGTKLGSTCYECGDDTLIDKQVGHEGTEYEWLIHDPSAVPGATTTWNPNKYIKIIESTPNYAKFYFGPDENGNMPTSDDSIEYTVVIQAASLLSVRGNTHNRHYDPVFGAIKLKMVKKPEGNMSPAGGFEYGAEPLTLDFDLQNPTGLICARIKTDNKNAPMSEDRVMIYETDGDNSRVSADLFGLDLDHDYYISLQVLDYPLSKGDPDYAAKRQYIETEYLTHLDSTGTYIGEIRSSSKWTVPLLRPQLSVEYNKKTYEGKEVHVTPISLLQNVDFIDISCEVTAVSSTRTSGERTLNAVNADLKFSGDEIYYFDATTKDHIDKLGKGKKGAYIYTSCSIDSIDKLKIYLDLKNNLSTNYSQEQITQTIKETVGNYYYVPRLAYANKDDGDRFIARVHYTSPNYAPEYALKYYLREESTIYFTITDEGNLKDLWVYTDKEINGSKFANGEIYFPLPSDSSFRNYFTMGNPALQTKVLWDSFRMKDKDGNIRTVGFTRATCEYIADKGEYEIELFYNCWDSLWQRNVELSAGKFRCPADGIEWKRSSDGDFDKELRNGKKVYEGDGTLNNIWAYTNENINGNNFANGEIYFPKPSEKSFSDYFGLKNTSVQSVNLSGSFRMKDKDGNIRNVVFTKATCEYIATRDEYEIELFYKCKDSLWNCDVELSAGRFKCPANGTRWTKLNAGAFDESLESGKTEYRGNGTANIEIGGKMVDTMIPLPTSSLFTAPTYSGGLGFDLNVIKNNGSQSINVGYFALDYMGDYGLAKAQVKDNITCSYDPGTKTYTLEITYWEGWSWENKPIHTIKLSCKEGDLSWH